MKREKLCESGIVLKKKKYIMYVVDNEGVRYAEPKIAMTGVEAVKSSTPSIITDKLKHAFKVILAEKSEEAMTDYIREVKDFFMSQPPSAIAFPRSANNISKYTSGSGSYIKGTPIQVRSVIMYNQLIKKYGLEKKYQIIKDGEKILFSYLKEPNPLGENVIGWNGRHLPKEMGLDEYIDYELQFKKTFMNVIQPILEAIGWDSVANINEHSMDSFFI